MRPAGPTRRGFVGIAGGTAAALGLPRIARARDQERWSAGALAHLIPAVDHRRFLIKASFSEPLVQPPVLRVSGRHFQGRQTDTRGFFWQFDAPGLAPDTEYRLRLFDAAGAPLCDEWPLRTFPHPDASPRRLRILTYTCGGGDDGVFRPDGTRFYLDMRARRALLERGLSFRPDVLIANGDQIYWDERTMTRHKPPADMAAWARAYAEIGNFDRNLPILGTANEHVLKTIGDRQIVALYGTLLRSTPSFMLTDDHDLFDNDEADAELITLPPDHHMMEAARAVQKLYYPEFLPDDTRPRDLPGSCAADRAASVSEVFGTLRWGRLFEALLFDTKRYATIDGAEAVMFPLATEAWLAARTANSPVSHLVHIPSTPIGWSAGKWGEWYPDLLNDQGVLDTARPKPFWPQGWWTQHQRLLAIVGNQPARAPLIVSGDLHMFASGLIRRSGELDFSANPIRTMVIGPLGTGDPAFPSAARGVLPQRPVDMEMDEPVPPYEKNGFSLLDVAPGGIDVSFYSWRPPEPIEAIAALAPAQRFRVT
jgi:hypothetical protein